MFKLTEDEDIDIFKQSDWGVSKTSHPLASIARSMLRARGITASVFESRISSWVKKHVPPNGKLRSSAKSNMSRTVRKNDTISWNTLYRLFSILELPEVTMYVKVKWPDGVETVHKHIIDQDEIETMSAEQLLSELSKSGTSDK